MTEADSVHSTPPLDLSALPKASPLLAESVDSFRAQPGTRQPAAPKPVSDLARLRKEASAEIDRLIAFLDATDPYVTTELEVDDGETGIADRDGALEQVGTQDWQQGALA